MSSFKCLLCNILIINSEVQAVELSSQGYTQAADLWSLGVLTATMLTGDCNIPRQELVGLSQVDIAERYFEAGRGVNESELRQAWLALPPRALSFIRKLLTLDVEDRMSAEESLNHSWLTKPHREAEALVEGIEKVIRFWTKSDIDKDILEALPGVHLPAASPVVTASPKLRRKLPDVSMASPYFGLDRHLYTREEPTRKRILDDLLESGSQFVTTKPPPLRIFAENSSSYRTSDKLVPANNLFGSSREEEQEISSTIDLDEVNLSSSIREKIYGSGLQENGSSKSPNIQPDLYDIPE